MLPINKLTKDAAAAFLEQGVPEENILAALHMDLDLKGNFGEAWLVLDEKRKRLCRLLLPSKQYNEFELTLLVNPYVDNFTTSNALLAYLVSEPLPPRKEGEDLKQYELACEDQVRKTGKTEIVGYCTNACKRRLFAFIHIWEKFMRGEEATEDDPVFEQFNAKCPKCGTVYADQNRRICEVCSNKKGIIFRLLEYFKPFKLQLGVVLICLILSSVVSLVSPIISGQLLYDQVVDSGDYNVRRAYESDASVFHTEDEGFFADVANIWNTMTKRLYYYYTPDENGMFVYYDGDSQYVCPLPDGTIYVEEDGNYIDEMGTEVLGNDTDGYYCMDGEEKVPLYKVTPTGQRARMVLTHNKGEAANTTRVTGMLHRRANVYLVVVLIVLLALFSLFIGIVQNRSNAYMSTRVTKNMKNDIFRAMANLSLSYFNQNPTGRLVNRVNYDAVKIRSFYIDGVPYLLVNLLNFVGLTFFLFSINWKLTLIVFVPIPIIVFIFKFMLPKLWRSYSRQWRRSSSMNAMLGDSLNGVRVVKAFAKEAEETHRFYEYSDALCTANLQTNMISIFIFPIVSLLIGMTSQAIWGFGGIAVMGKTMTYGQLTTYLGYLGMIFGPLNFFSTFTNLITDTINSAERMFEVLDMIPEISDVKNPVELNEIKGDITFDQVCFHYAPNRPILKDVSFEIHAGDHVGLVGHTGSGKSTIANLITRMYDTISGTISIDGHNIKEIKIASLRRNIAIVSQEIYLFGGTIADNIRYARPDATMDEVIAAARAANAHDFIMRLPEGYETRVGIGHRSLSGGERQRVSIARALLLAPSLLILDEATAAMDNETERLISEAIDKLIEGRTTISIAHRLSTLKNCNYLMAIEHGELAEMGTAEELLRQKGVYYKLYTLQNEQMQQVMKGL